ncbi:hypothetical protein AAC387_Pa01g4020 [Persea americana]
MGYEKLDETFVFDGRSQKLERKLKDRIRSGRDLRCIGKNAVSRRYHGRCLLLCVSEPEVIDEIKRCLTDDQRERIRNNQEIPVVGFDEEGNEWGLKLRKEKKIHRSFIFETKMTSRSEEKMDGISIWGFPYGGSGDDAQVVFVFTL